MALHEGQGHSLWYKNKEFSYVYHDIKFEQTQLISVKTQANLKHVLFKITKTEFSPSNINHAQKKVGMNLNRPRGYDKIAISSTENFARKRAHMFSLSHTPVTLNEGQGQSHLHQTIQFCGVCNHTNFDRN